jgi:hypothetical protein
MNTKSKILISIIDADTLNANKKTLVEFDYYKNISDLIERTNIALGRRKTYLKTSLSTINTQFNINAIKSTQKI